MRHSTLVGFVALLVIALAGASALAVAARQRDTPEEAGDFSGSGIEGYNLVGTIGGPLIPTTPVDVAVDESGRIFVADIGLNRVLAFTPDGALDTAWGDGGMSERLAFPSGLALGPNDSLYVLQLGNAEVHVMDSDGSERDVWSVAGQEELAGVGAPVAITVDADGTVYIPDQRSQQIRRYESDGDELDSWPFPVGEVDLNQLWPRDIEVVDGQIVLSYADQTGGSGGLLAFASDGSAMLFEPGFDDVEGRSPGSIAVRSDGLSAILYLSNDIATPPLIATADGVWQPEGIASLTPINGLVVPGIAADNTGQVLIADPAGQRVRQYDAAGSVTGDIQSPDASGLLGGLDEIVATADGLVYAADPLRGQVIAYQQDGNVQTSFELPTDPDAPLTTGFTRQRMRMTVDGFGSVYVVDEFTGRITKFRQDGAVVDTDWAGSENADEPIVALMLAAGNDERVFLVDLTMQDRVRVFSDLGEDLGVLVEPFWQSAIQDIAVAGDTLYTVELGTGTSPVRSFTTAGDYLDELVDLSRGDGNSNRTGFALAVEPNGDLLIGAVNVASGPEFEYQLLRLTTDGNLRRIGTLDVPFTTLPDIAVGPTGVLYIAAPNDQRIYVYEPEP